DVMDITFVLRSMLFSFPVHVAAFAAIGVSAKQVVTLEGFFLIGSSMSQLVGGVINDALSPRLAYGLGKFVSATACAAIALFHNSVSLSLLFTIWGIGVGIYDGSDFLSAKRKNSNWSSILKHVESLGIYGSFVSFICGAAIFRWFGFETLFMANAIASFCIPIILFLKRKNIDETQYKTSNIKQIKFNLFSWVSSILSAPFIAIIGYAAVTVALKVVVIELQHYLVVSGINVFWNGWIFVGFTVLVYFTLRLRPYVIGFLLVPIMLILALCWGFNISGIIFGLAITSLAIVIRTAHKVLFFATLAEKSTTLTLGRDSSFAQVLSGIFLLTGTKVSFISPVFLLIISASIAIFSFYTYESRRIK
ncbi:MAG: hypothetical protein PHY93_13475, partial [Bacteriovorax sp.]|nr:hypothetical protein [Bacteriovorax sp.]